MPILLEISKNNIQVHVYKSQSRTVGLAYVRNNSSIAHVPKLCVVNDTGALSMFPTPGAKTSSSKSDSGTVGSVIEDYFTQDMLPQKVLLPTDVFQDSIELSNGAYEPTFYYTGDFKTSLGSNRSTINVMNPNPEPLIRGGSKKSIKMVAKLDNIGADKPNNDIVMVGFRVCCYHPDKYGSPEADGKVMIKLFNRKEKLKNNRKYYEIGLCEAEILYLNLVKKNELEVEFITKDPTHYPITIYGVDVFGRRKDQLKLTEKATLLYNMCEQEKSSIPEEAVTEVVQELMQSETTPVLVNWKEKFDSTEKLLETIKNKEIKDQNRLLFYLSEAATPTIEHMTEKQIENDLLYNLNPLIGEYICKVEEKNSKTATSSKLILESLIRLLKECLAKLKQERDQPSISITKSKYNCFINYLKDTLEPEKPSIAEGATVDTPISTENLNLSVSQVHSFIKVAYHLANDHQKHFFYFLENVYASFVTDLVLLVQHVVLKDIEVADTENRKTNQTADEQCISECLFLIFSFHSFVKNTSTFSMREGAPTVKSVLDLLKPFLYSPSDFVKRTVATKIKTLCSFNYANQIQQKRREKASNTEDAEMQEEQDSEDEMNIAIQMSLKTSGAEGKQVKDAVMQKEGPNSHTRIYDVTLDLMELFKEEIITHAQNNDIFEVDLIIYLLTRCIKIYGKFRSSLSHESFDQMISDYLIEIMDKAQIFNFNDISNIKSKQCETTFVLLEVLNSLLNYRDEQPNEVASRYKGRKGFNQKLADKSAKDNKKLKMRSRMIFNFLERLAHRVAHDKNFEIAKSFASTIEQFINYFLDNKGSIVIDKKQLLTKLSSDKPMVSEEGEENSLLKVKNKEHMWRWHHIFRNNSVPQSSSRHFDLQLFKSYLDLLSNILHFERMMYVWNMHQSKQEAEGDKEKQGVKSRRKQTISVGQEKEAMKIFGQFESNIVNDTVKDKLKDIIPNAVFHLKTDKIQASLTAILRCICKDEKEYHKFQHLSAYKFYFSVITQIYEESAEFRKPLPYEKLFNIINILSTLWNKYGQNQPDLWRSYAIDNPEILKMLFKAAYNIVEEGAYPCLCLLATAFETNKEYNIREYIKENKEGELERKVGGSSRSKRKHKKEKKKSKEEVIEVKPQDIDMEDEDTKNKINELVTLFTNPIKSFIESFVFGKNSKMLRVAATYFIKGLWESANEEYKVKIFNLLITKIPYLHYYGIKAVEFFTLITYILKEQDEEDRNVDSNNQSSMKMSDVFKFVKQSLTKANDMIYSHQNLELYSSIYSLVGNTKPSLESFGPFGQKKPLTEENGRTNVFIFEQEPCVKCYEGVSEPYTLQAVNDIKSDMKSNEQSQVFKLATPMQIKEVTLLLMNCRVKKVTEVSIYTNNSQKAELSSIKRDKSAWTFIMTMKVTDERGENRCKFPVPITACNLMFEFHVVNSNKTQTSSGGKSRKLYGNPYGYEYDQDSFNYNSYLGGRAPSYQTFSVNNKEVLNCPRCQTIVEDSHGVCNTCRENAFQCTFCRNINYENLEAFLCNDCGLSRYGKYEFSILAKPDFAVEKIKNEKMKDEAETNLENTLIVAQTKYYKIDERRQSLISKVKMLNGSEGISPINDIQSLFSESVVQYHAMMKSLENARSLRKEILEFEQVKRGEEQYDTENFISFEEQESSAMEVDNSNQEQESGEVSNCFGCTFSFLSVLLKFINETASIEEFNSLYLDSEFINKLYNENMKMFSANQRNPTRLALCKIVGKSKDSSMKMLKIIENSIYSHTKEKDDAVPHHMLSTVIHEDIEMLISLSKTLEKTMKNKDADDVVEAFNECLKAIVRILLYSIEIANKSAPIASELIVN